MFQTFPSAQIQFLPLFGEKHLLWSMVEHDIHRPWFYVTVVNLYGDLDMRSMVMAGNEDSLQEILQSQQADCYVEGVMVATPGHVNGTARWQLEPLEKLVAYREKGGGSSLVYSITDGRTYVMGEQSLVRDDHPDQEMLYSTGMLRVCSSGSD
ncbi:hypothetical protein D3880_11675 [Pseudomonas cavernae]|uniref:Uncharacterized protein n=1 Tax=Pseudomonas cavernae TaxID=2320867 RepID=A0A385Z4H3_9PSED|nr:hypothetical protein [Pseudomonas cavernae]AYC32987.1 hypothetical protein D3880_11675 [Pseudomonas cavernae]